MKACVRLNGMHVEVKTFSYCTEIPDNRVSLVARIPRMELEPDITLASANYMYQFCLEVP